MNGIAYINNDVGYNNNSGNLGDLIHCCIFSSITKEKKMLILKCPGIEWICENFFLFLISK